MKRPEWQRHRAHRWHRWHHWHDWQHWHQAGHPFHGAHGGWQKRPRALRRQLFGWLAGTILVTAIVVGSILRLGFEGERRATWTADGMQHVVAGRFAKAWKDAADRDAFARELATALGARITLTDALGRELVHAGGECNTQAFTLPVQDGGVKLGDVSACFPTPRWRIARTGILALVGGMLSLWFAAAFAARRITRPLSQLVWVTRQIGSGNLSARVRIGHLGRGELGVLSEAIDDMATRIERQLREQRELLAVVSHELRSPISRMRICSELLRTSNNPGSLIDKLEREIAELDDLIGRLLAQSRLDFAVHNPTEIGAAELAGSVLRRRGSEEAVLDECADAVVSVDSTLIARALDNLLDNAERYGQAPIRVRVRPATELERAGTRPAIAFEVEDAGPGIPSDALSRVFEAFYRTGERRGAEAAGLGLGLSLVKRIAEAHGGRAFAYNREGSGSSRVGFCVAWSLPPP